MIGRGSRPPLMGQRPRMGEGAAWVGCRQGGSVGCQNAPRLPKADPTFLTCYFCATNFPPSHVQFTALPVSVPFSSTWSTTTVGSPAASILSPARWNG